MEQRVLPPGQRATATFERFGLPRYAEWWPVADAPAAIAVLGAVEREFVLTAADLASIDRVEQTCDFHCVTTWTVHDLRWGGWRLRDVYERVVVPRAGPAADARWLRVRGLDGFPAIIMLDDALDPSVLLADRLRGEPLDVAHGAPWRIVSPSQYGFKSVKHVCALEPAREYVPVIPDVSDHPRARVAGEERGEGMPVESLREIYRDRIDPTRATFRNAELARTRQDREAGRSRRRNAMKFRG